MGYTAEGGNFEGRSRAHGGFGNETGQTERRGRSGAAEKANRDAINRRRLCRVHAGRSRVRSMTSRLGTR
jgi:hypothetical protein